MKKFEIGFIETLKYRRNITIETDMPETKLDYLLDLIENKSECSDDVVCNLKSDNLIYKINILEVDANNFDCPYDAEIEIDDLNELEGKEN